MSDTQSGGNMMGSLVPAPSTANPVIELQQPVFFPDILPIYIIKVHPEAGLAAAEAAASEPAPPAPVHVPANVDDPTSNPGADEPPPAPGPFTPMPTA